MATSLRTAPADAASQGSSLLQQQLLREIACLTRQLEHACAHSFVGTTEVYQEMIIARNRMLNNLPYAGR